MYLVYQLGADLSHVTVHSPGNAGGALRALGLLLAAARQQVAGTPATMG